MLKNLKTIAAALILGQVLMAVVILSVQQKTIKWNDEDFMVAACAISMIIFYFIGQKLFTLKLSEAKEVETLVTKMQHYTTAVLLRLALLEAISIFSIVLFFIFANGYLLFVAAASIGLQLYFFPNKTKVVNDLELNMMDTEGLD